MQATALVGIGGVGPRDHWHTQWWLAGRLVVMRTQMRRSLLGRLPDWISALVIQIIENGPDTCQCFRSQNPKGSLGTLYISRKARTSVEGSLPPSPCSSLSLPHTIATWVKKKRYPSGMREHRVFVSHRIDLECSRLSTPLLVLCSLVVQGPISKCKPQFMPPKLVTARI